MSRYHPLLVILHWVTALLIAVTFLMGMFVLVPMPNNGQKIVPVSVHMLLGLLILVLTVTRYLVRLKTLKPLRKVKNPLAKKKPLIVTMAEPVQYLLYLFSILMSLTGIGLALQAGILGQMFSNGMTLPQNFYDFPLRTIHGTISTVLFVLIVLHLLTWVYYQFLRGENALAWMWFNKKKKKTDQAG